MVSGFELELPKKGDLKGKTIWRGTRALWSGRQGAREEDDRSVTYTLADDGDPLQITWESKAGSAGGMAGTSLVSGADVVSIGSATFDATSGRVTHIATESAATSKTGGLQMLGPSRRISVSAPWAAGESMDPGVFPQPTLP